MEAIDRILRELDTIAVVGLSADPNKAAHAIPAKMQRAGYRIVPVNPKQPELLGEPAFAKLEDIPFPVELVLVFRPSAEAAAIAQSAVAIGAKALWLQQGIHSEAARKTATDAGLLYVEDHCIGVERALRSITKAPRGAQ